MSVSVMRFLAGLLVLMLALMAAAPSGASEKAVWRKQQLTYQGMPREFWIYVPTSARGKGDRPLVLMLHGGGGHAGRFDKMVKNGLKPRADRDGVILVYPQAYKRQWNDGRGAQTIAAHVENVDDVGFLDEVIDHVDRQYGVDEDRIYATGISNGGMMSARLACDLSDRLAAVALVASAMPEPLSHRCSPSSPVSMLIINGTEDRLVPYEGGSVAFGRRGEVVSTPDTARLWAKKLGFDPNLMPVRQTLMPDADPGDGTRVLKIVYSGAGDTHVVLYRIDGGGHTWPQGKPFLPLLAGRVSQDLDATRIIWEFFQNHPKRP